MINMKRLLKKWTPRILGAGLLFIAVLLLFVLNPTLLYANKTKYNNLIIYHNSPLPPNFKTILDEASRIVKSSELYNPDFKIHICLNDGSGYYPKLIQSFHPPAFGIGFYNIVVVMGRANWKENIVTLNGYKWNLSQLIAHEQVHCFQFHKLGLMKSNPIAKYPLWKWEGYNEYIARRNEDQISLLNNIDRLYKTKEKNKNEWCVLFADSTVVDKTYYNWWLLMQYCKDVKKMTYNEILRTKTTEESIKKEMMNWYSRSIKK